MARTKGARDIKPRKHTKKPAKPAKPPAARPIPVSVAVARGAAPDPGAAPPREQVNPADFDRAIEAALAAEPSTASGQEPAPGDSTACPAPAVLSTPVGFDPQSVSISAWQDLWELPFWLLGGALKLFGVTRDSAAMERAGRRRAKDLGKASYTLWQHYAGQYAGIDPLNPVHLSIGATALIGVTCVRDIAEAVAADRRIETPPNSGSASPTPQGGPAPAAARPDDDRAT
jgi:hypothetical protein